MWLTGTTHNHCTHCDGKLTAVQMADAAEAAGFTAFGFSSHSDPFCGNLNERAYVEEILRLKSERKGRLDILLGIEQDFFRPVESRAAFDYLIGSVHYIKGPKTGKLHPVDWGEKELQACLDEFDGDGIAMVRAYYALLEENVRRFSPDVVGHFDLIVKNNASGRFFDENSPDYRKAALHALHVCIESGGIIEMNTGGVYRGYRETFYPAPFLLEELARLDGKVTLNADAHDAQGLCFGLSHALEQARKAGIGRIFMPSANGFISKSIKDLPSAEKNGMIQKEE